MRTLSLYVSVALLGAFGCGDDGSGTGETTGDTTGGTSTSTSTTTGVDSGSTTDPSTSDSTTAVDSSTGGGMCGNGEVDPGEECDDDNTDNTDSCASDCTLSVEELWTVSYNGPASHSDFFNDVVLDDQGNIYVVGTHRQVVPDDNIIVKQYMPDGTEGWTYEYAGTGDDPDYGNELAWHPSGDLVIVGTTTTAQEGTNMLVIRLATGDQSEVWVDEYDGPGMGMEDPDNDDFGSAVAVDSAGNIIVVGRQRNNEEHNDILVRKLDPSDGSETWQQTFSGALMESDSGRGVAVDSADNIYALGVESVAAQDDNGWLRKYDPDGAEIWTQSVDWIPTDIVLDADENIVLGGWGSVDTDVTVAKYDPDFTQLWLFSYQGPGNGFDAATGLFIGDSGEVYMGGEIVEPAQQGNFWTAKLDADGNAVWATSYNNEQANLAEASYAVAVDANGDVVSVGYETALGMQQNGFIRKIGQL